MNSKMFKSRNEKFIMVENKYILNCSHYINQIYYKCPEASDDHIHCGRCGIIMKNRIKINSILNSKYSNIRIFTYRGSCFNLMEHHKLFYA